MSAAFSTARVLDHLEKLHSEAMRKGKNSQTSAVDRPRRPMSSKPNIAVRRPVSGGLTKLPSGRVLGYSVVFGLCSG
jgi:hypothetical protein